MTANETVKVLRVVVVSPSDVKPERECVSKVLEEINRLIARPLGLRLEPWKWETDSYPAFHPEGPQGLIDDLMTIESSSVVIGLFWKRFGTPVPDAGSGTEHELRRAIAARRKNGKPEIMIYFCKRAYTPETAAELDQWKAVITFRESIANEQGLYWTFDATQEFESLLLNHLGIFLQHRFKEPSHAHPTARSAQFAPPIFSLQTPREDSVTEIERLSRLHPIVAIEGLPGSGKSFLASQFAQYGVANSLYDSIYWYSPSKGETLDETLLQLGSEFPSSGLSAAAKATDLIGQLRRRKSLLVIDDFHLVDQASYAQLIESAAKFGTPAALLLTSQTYVDARRGWTFIGRIEVGGFSTTQLDIFLRGRGVPLDKKVLDLLCRRTDGLPLAISLFATLVTDFNRQPMDLLQSEIETTDRLRGWFDEVSNNITAAQRELLAALGVHELPFDFDLVRHACHQLAIENFNGAFEGLQRKYLIQRHGPFRWRVHQLITHFSNENLSPQTRRDLLVSFARHSLKGISRERTQVLSEVELGSAARAIRFFQRARHYKQSENLLKKIAPSVKIHGLYDLYITAAEVELRENRHRNSWLDYHAAHCYMITGRLQRSFEIVELLVFNDERSDPSKRISIVRLYAELLAAVGRHDVALHKLREAWRVVSAPAVHETAAAQARNAEASILIELGKYEEALAIGKELLLKAGRRRRGAAVAYMIIGISEARRGDSDQGLRHLRQALDDFRSCADVRGQAWALGKVAAVLVDVGELQPASDALLEAMEINYRIGTCSAQYREFLGRMKRENISSDCKIRISSELARVENILSMQPTAVVGRLQ